MRIAGVATLILLPSALPSHGRLSADGRR